MNDDNLYGAQHPRDPFQLGQQPAFLSDAGEGEKVAVIGGAGWAYKQYAATAMQHRGSQVYVVDPNEWNEAKRQYKDEQSFLDDRQELKAKLKSAEQAGEISPELAKETMQALKEAGMDYVMISSPSPTHAAYIKAAQEVGLPAMVQAPLVAGNQFQAQHDMLAELDHQILDMESGKAPLYAMNPGALAATPLIAVMNDVARFDGMIEGDVETIRNQFDHAHVEKVDVNWVQGFLHNPTRQQELPVRYNVQRGGGALFDLAVEPLSALAAAGFAVTGVKEAQLLTAPDGDTIQKDDTQTSDQYATARLTSKQGDREIPVNLMVGRGVKENAGERIIFTDKDGKTLEYKKIEQAEQPEMLVPQNAKPVRPENMEMKPVRFCAYEVTLRDGERELGKAVMKADPYALAIEEASRFFEREKGTGRELNYARESGVANVLTQIQALGRGIELTPPAIADLGVAQHKAPAQGQQR